MKQVLSRLFILALLVSGIPSGSANAQLTFNFQDVTAGGAPTEVLNGFAEAGDLWSNLFNDNITINVEIDFASLGSGILGSTSNNRTLQDYSVVRSRMVADASSADDLLAVANLQAAPGNAFLINRTSDNPNGVNSATPYLDTLGANNTSIRLSRSNAKALGIISGTDAGIDGAITFSSNFSWDFDRSDGIEFSQFDFVGVAAHEIGHLLGFTSGVDILDFNTGFQDDQLDFVNTLDMFRYSNDTAFGVQMDWTADNREKYFSIDGGTTELATFSNGINFGDGRQASHWKDNLNIGLMDPTIANGEFGDITELDIRAFDVIGYDLAAIPEPGSLAVLTCLGLGIAARRRRS